MWQALRSFKVSEGSKVKGAAIIGFIRIYRQVCFSECFSEEAPVETDRPGIVQHCVLSC